MRTCLSLQARAAQTATWMERCLFLTPVGGTETVVVCNDVIALHISACCFETRRSGEDLCFQVCKIFFQSHLQFCASQQISALVWLSFARVCVCVCVCWRGRGRCARFLKVL